MKNTLTFLAALAAATFTCAATAQEASMSTPEDAVGNEAAVETKSAMEVVNEYLAAKDWTKGNNTKKDGSRFYVAVGFGTILAPLDSRNYADSRVNAYNKAMLDAKEKMANYLGVWIRSETEKALVEPPDSAVSASVDGEPSDMGMVSKIKLLANAKLDAALRAEGLDPDKADREARERAAKKLLSSETFSKAVSAGSRAEITGMQVACSFECVPSGQQGQIAVVAIWSEKLQSMALSISRGGRLPGGVGKRPVKEQIPSDKKVLLSTFGVQQKIDENGNLVLVAFGQSGARTDSPSSAQAAYNKARLLAMSAIREFAGETVMTDEDMNAAESFEQFENAAPDYKDASSYTQRVKAKADEMKISGISTIKEWECKHPLSGRMVYGVVCSWSPESAARAQSMKRAMDAAAAGARGYGASQPVANPNGSLQGQGADADEDAF